MKEIIRFQIEAREKKKMEAEAKKLGLSISAFMRLLFRNWSNGIRFEKDKTQGEV